MSESDDERSFSEDSISIEEENNSTYSHLQKILAPEPSEATPQPTDKPIEQRRHLAAVAAKVGSG